MKIISHACGWQSWLTPLITRLSAHRLRDNQARSTDFRLLVSPAERGVHLLHERQS
jgi:hypothetical protein